MKNSTILFSSFYGMMIWTKLSRIFILMVFLGAMHFTCFAQPLRIAVAANAQGVIKKLQADFTKRTGIKTEVIIGSSGKLSAQIMNGAPYDVFLSADTEFPEKLYANRFSLFKPRIYALGSLIICGHVKGDLSDWQKMLSGKQINKIAIANPKIAPYGEAALQTLKFYHLLDKLNARLVYGESISQVNTYVQTKVVPVAFTTESFLYDNFDKRNFQWARINQNSYEEIAQSALLLSHAKNGKLKEATKFYDYLFSESARRIIGTNGYYLPKN